MKVLIDENLSPKWANVLEAKGHIATHWMNLGAIGAPDDEIWDFASKHGFLVLSKDLDFSRLLAQKNTTVPSVIQLRVDNPSPSEWGDMLSEILNSYEKQIQQGCLITIKPDQHRIRILPIHPNLSP
jgi:predicted nuclease of predicted toxin-antitoxin system